MHNQIRYLLPIVLLLVLIGCKDSEQTSNSNPRISVIFDTDTNNEIDDQHALAYLLLNENTFDVKGVTVNATFNGGDIKGHFEEAKRVIQLCDQLDKIPLYKGANASFPEIRDSISTADFDGFEAVNFIIKTATQSKDTLTLIAVGKLTNVALALEKAPSIATKIRLVWLGSNYPEPGEYNMVNDTSAMNYLLNSPIHFEMVTVRSGKESGTDAIRVTQKEANEHMPGKGPIIDNPVTGRHGGNFYTFGDYSVNLFDHIDYYGDPPSRALFDMAAVAIVKNPHWAEYSQIPAPILINGNWIARAEKEHRIGIWENFKKIEILNDFFSTFDSIYTR